MAKRLTTLADWAQVAELRRLALKSLFALRFEVRLRSARGVAHMQECLYVLHEAHGQPDPFVYALVEELAAVEATLAAAVTPAKMHYIFGSVAALLCAEIVFSLRRLDGINAQGILKVRKNVFALQQLLPSSIVRAQEPIFDRVRIYYELLKLEPNVRIAFLSLSLTLTPQEHILHAHAHTRAHTHVHTLSPSPSQCLPSATLLTRRRTS